MPCDSVCAVVGGMSVTSTPTPTASSRGLELIIGGSSHARARNDVPRRGIVQTNLCNAAVNTVRPHVGDGGLPSSTLPPYGYLPPFVTLELAMVFLDAGLYRSKYDRYTQLYLIDIRNFIYI